MKNETYPWGITQNYASEDMIYPFFWLRIWSFSTKLSLRSESIPSHLSRALLLSCGWHIAESMRVVCHRPSANARECCMSCSFPCKIEQAYFETQIILLSVSMHALLQCSRLYLQLRWSFPKEGTVQDYPSFPRCLSKTNNKERLHSAT